MPNDAVLDLTLDVDAKASGYRLRLKFRAPGHDVPREADFPTQLNPTELLAHQLDAMAYGQALYRQLFAERAAEVFVSECRAAAGSAPLRLRLCLRPEASELHRMHWETLRTPQGDPLTTGDRVWFSRYLISDQVRDIPLRPRADLRALVAIANPVGSGLDPVNVPAERERVLKAWGDDKSITVLNSTPGERATLNNLARHLRDGYDVFYIVAHGKFNQDESESALWLEDEAGNVARVKGEELLEQLGEITHWPRLIVLLTCQSARPEANEHGALLSLGPRLSAKGVPAVLAMQGDFSMATSAAFMPEFFRELRQHGQIDQAGAVARSVAREKTDAWMPTLFLRSESGRLWANEAEAVPIAQMTVTGDQNIVVQGSQNTVNITIQQGLKSLAGLIERSPAAREALGKYGAVVEIVGTQIQELGDYKCLHDGLHKIQFDCYDQIRFLSATEVKRPQNRMAVESGLEVLGEVMADAKLRAARLPRKEREIEWVSLIALAQAQLRATLPPKPAAEALEDAKGTLLRLLNRAPGRVDRDLLGVAKNLRLKDLVRALNETLPVFRQFPPNIFNADDFDYSLSELRRFDERLTALCYAHTDWQELIDTVREVEASLKDETVELTDRWDDLYANTNQLCQVNPPLATLLDNADMVNELLAQCAVVATAPRDDAETVRYEFGKYRRYVNLLFRRLDDNLKIACDELIATAKAPLTHLAHHLMV